MAWSPGFQTNLPNVREAISLALQAQLVDNLTSLNAALNAGGIAPTLPGPVQVTAAQVTLGDLDSLPDVGVASCWFQIVAGGERDARDVEATLESGPAIYQYFFSTNVDFYIHPMTFPGLNAFVQAQYRELLRSRVTDWLLFAVFNASTELSLELTSQTFTNAPFDQGQKTILGDITAGYVDRGFGGSQRVYSLHCNVKTEIHGSVG